MDSWVLSSSPHGMVGSHMQWVLSWICRVGSVVLCVQSLILGPIDDNYKGETQAEATCISSLRVTILSLPPPLLPPHGFFLPLFGPTPLSVLGLVSGGPCLAEVDYALTFVTVLWLCPGYPQLSRTELISAHQTPRKGLNGWAGSYLTYSPQRKRDYFTD